MTQIERWMAALGLAACLGGPGCVSASGSITEKGFRHEKYDYGVVSGGDGILDSHWLLDNFHQGTTSELVQNSSDAYISTFHLDTDGDREPDRTVREPTYDLRYKHRERGGVIWLRTFPISSDLRQSELRVLMQSYVDEIAGAGYEDVDLDPIGVLERRFAAAIVERGQATLGGQPAYLATIDVANIDQIRLTPASRRTRVRLVMVRTFFTYEASGAARRETFPVLMMAGYSNLPEDFDRDLPSFDRFLGQIEIAGRRGWSVAGVEKLSPEGPGASTPSTPAPARPGPPAPLPADSRPADPTSIPAEGEPGQ